MELTYKEIRDYMRCPMLYKFKYILKLERDGDKNSEVFETTILSVAMYFYYNIMNGVVPRKEDIMNRWSKTWQSQATTIEDILFQKNSLQSQARTSNMQGIKALGAFYESEMKRKFNPIVVDTEARLKAGDHYIIERFDLIREAKEKGRSIVEVVRLAGSNTNYSDFQAMTDFRTAFQVRAFRELFQAKERRVHIYNIKRGQHIYPEIGETEFKRMESIVSQVGDSIEDGRFYPVAHNSCNHCPYQDVCIKYQF